MASANLDLVRSIVADWERGDFSSAEWAHPEIEFEIADGPSPGTSTGLAGMAKGWRDWLSAWEDVSIEVEECRGLDNERVLVLVHASGLGKTSGLKVEEIWRKGVTVFHVCDCKVTKLVVYLDRERALADLGLAPRASSR